MTGRPVRTIVLLVVIALLAFVPLVAWDAIRDPSKDATPHDDDFAAADPSPTPRARARVSEENDAPATVAAPPEPTPSGGPVYSKGWPAADVIVRESNGSRVSGAVVYLLPAGDSSPSNLGLIPVRRMDDDGVARLPVARAGRYDVGAFQRTPFGAVALDVEFPAQSRVELVLPDLVRLEIQRRGDLPQGGWVTFARADASRISAFPGRHESRSVGGAVRVMDDHVLVPRDVRIRVRATGGVAAQPEELVAPGPVVLYPDPRREVPVEFVFVPAPELAEHRCQFTFRFEATPGDRDSEERHTVRLRPSPEVTKLGTLLLCPEALTTVRWRVTSDPGRGGGEAVIDAAAVGATHRVEVPVTRDDLFLFGFRVVPPVAQEVRELRVLTAAGPLFGGSELVPDREYWFGSPHESSDGFLAVSEPIAAVAEGRDGPLVAVPTHVSEYRVVDLRLVPGAFLRVQWTRPAGLHAAWPLQVAPAEPKLRAEMLVDEPTPALVAEAAIRESSALLGPFPEGSVELVFRFGDREIGRRRVNVVPGSPIDVEAPEILPPPR